MHQTTLTLLKHEMAFDYSLAKTEVYVRFAKDESKMHTRLYDEEGIWLNPEKTAVKAVKNINKLLLNSLWGRENQAMSE